MFPVSALFVVVAVAFAAVFSALPARIVSSATYEAAAAEGDTLLTMYPITSSRNVTLGSKTWRVPVPYHTFGAKSNILVGPMDFAAVQKVLDDFEKEAKATDPHFKPLQLARDADGKAIGMLWLMEYPSTAIGPYLEVVVSALTGGNLPCAQASDPFCFERVWGRPGTAGLVMRLWLDSDVAIAYGRDLLGCDKHSAEFDVDFAAGKFNVKNVLTSRVQSPPMTWEPLVGIARNIGVTGLLRALTTPFIDAAAIGKPGLVKGMPSHVLPMPVLRAVVTTSTTFHTFDAAKYGDALEVTDPFLKSLGFTPVLRVKDHAGRFAFIAPFN